MAGFRLDTFKGLRPRITASKLERGEAVTAQNLKLGSGDLEPIPEKTTVQAVGSGRSSRSIYLFDNAGNPLWFEWDDYVDVVRGPVKDDSIERTYYTGDTTGNGAPKLTTTELADLGGGGPYPEDWLYVGVPAPVLAPTVTVTETLAEAKPAGERLAFNFKSNEFIIDRVSWTTYPGTGTRNQTWRPLTTAGDVVKFDSIQLGSSYRVTSVINANKVTLESETEPGTTMRTEDSISKQTNTSWKPMDEQGSTQEADFLGWRIPVDMEVTIDDHRLVVGDVIAVGAINQPVEFSPTTTTDFYEQSWNVEALQDTIGGSYYYSNTARVSPSAVTGDSQWSIGGSFYYDVDRAASLLSELEDRSYVYTYVNSLGEEGPPSPPSPSASAIDGRTTLISAMSLPPTIGYDITLMRLYRINSTEAGTEYQFVKEFSVSRTTTDDVDSIDLAEVIATTTWDPPPAGMLGITTMPNGMLVGFKGKQLYFCEPYFPHAYPAEYDQAVDYNIVGLASFGNSVVALTEGWPYIVTGAHPRNVNVRPIKVNQACVSKESIATHGDKVYYASPDGIIEIGINGIRLATEALMDKSDWATYSPSTLVAEFHEGRYYGFYDFDVSVVDPVIAAEVSGTITAADETDIIDGASTVIITLQNDAWVAAGTAFNNQRQNIIDGLDATTNQTLGWNNTIRDAALVVSNVVRTSDTVVTITLPVVPGYAISSSEAIETTVPATALLLSSAAVIAGSTFTIEPAASVATVTLTGTLAGATEANVVSGGKTIIITLTNDTWVTTLTDAMKQQIIDGLNSSTNEQDGWNDTVPQLIVVGVVVRTSASVVTVTLPAVPGYSVVSNESISAVIPHEALVLQEDVDADSINSLGIVATGAISALFTGTVVTGGVTEAEIVVGGDTIIITLTNDTWVAAGTGPIGTTAVSQSILDALVAQTSQTLGWNNTVVAEIDVATDLVRTSSTVATITLDPVSTYSIATNETVGMAIPAAALTSAAGFNVLNTFGITAQAPVTVGLTGTITSSNEDDIVAGGKTIILTVTNDTWLAAGTGPIGSTANTQAIIDGLTAASTPGDGFGWNDQIRDGSLTPSQVVRTSDNICTITLVADAQYDTGADETITATVPAAALNISSGAVVASPTFVVAYIVPTTAVVTGTIISSTISSDIVTGGKDIIITLSDDTWAASGSAFNAIRQDIIDGLDSAQSEGGGWNAKVRDVIAVTTAVRTSDTIVTVTLPAIADYVITATETITVTVPASSLVTSSIAVTATPTFAVAEAATAVITGTINSSAITEADVVAGGKTIIITLSDDTWIAAGSGPIGGTADTQAIIDGIVAAASPSNGWNNELITGGTLLPANVVRTNDTVCTITVPADAQYDIASVETITATIPAAVLTLSSAAVVATPTVAIVSLTKAALTGTLTSSAVEADIVAGGKTLIITLTEGEGDTWLAAGTGPIGSTANTQAIIDGLTAAASPTNGWNNEIRDGSLTPTQVVRTSSKICTITLVADAGYDIGLNETITATIPAQALTNNLAVVATPTVVISFQCAAGASAIPNLSDTTDGLGTPAEVGAKWVTSDSKVYTREGGSSWSTDDTLWTGGCADTLYEGRWNKISGDAPSGASGSDGVWHDMTTDVMVEYVTPADDFIYSGSFTFELRRTSDSVIILTDAFTMYAEEEASP